MAPSPLGGGAAWAIGFLLYNWAAPLEIPAWTAAMSTVFHDFLGLPFPAGVPGLSATALGFVVALVIATGASWLRLRRPALRGAF
jgi:uncharacterized membrane protein YccC